MTVLKDLTTKQKAAVIGSLVVIAKSNRAIDLSANNYIEQTAKLMAIKLNEIENELSRFNKNDNNILTVLNTISRQEKEIVLASFIDLLARNGEPNPAEFGQAFSYIKGIGFTKEEFHSMVKKLTLLRNKFRL